MASKEPALAHAIIMRAFSNVYADNALAESFLRLHKDWLDVTFITPGGLVEDVGRGHELSSERSSPFVSYADLGAGMVQGCKGGRV